jgi:NADH-quinone oxidoreductase subunit N
MTIFLLSLGGIPPTAGFIGKFYLFAGLIETGNPWLVRLAILAVLMSAVSLYYYIRFIRAMYIEPETEMQPVRLAAPLQAALGLAAVFVIFIGVYPQPLIRMTQRAAVSQGLKTYEYPKTETPGATPEPEDAPVVLPPDR